MLKHGSELPAHVQADCLRRYVHRFTGDHIPRWAIGRGYMQQFKDDKEWLANTLFHVRQDGHLDNRYRSCESTPTWNR